MKYALKITLTSVMLFTAPIALSDNLLDIYRLAQDNDPSYLANEAGTMAANERVNQSMAALLPQINARLSHSVSTNDFSSRTTGLITPTNPAIPPQTIENVSNSQSDTTSNAYSVSLTQQIYNHASWLSLGIAEKRALQSNVNLEGSHQDLIIRVAEAYFNVLTAQDNVEFSKAETKAVAQKLAQTNQRFEVGLIAITEVHEAQSRYDRAVANQIIAQNALDNSHELLQLITGRYHYDLLALRKDITPQKPQPEDIKKWMSEAQKNNTSVKATSIGLDIAKKSISISQAGHYPTLDLSASYSDNDSDITSPSRDIFDNAGLPLGILSNSVTNNQSKGSSIAVNFNIPIYSGGRTNSQVKEAQQLYLQAAHNLEASRRLAVSQTRSSYLGVVANVGSVKAFKQAVLSAEKSLEATQAGFEVGTRTIVDVLLQTQLLFDAKRQYSRARYDYVLNTLRLKRATGLLSEQDLSKVNQMLR
ncbi:MAG: TolC family outer membrane protein [Enterobacterales bacterium]|nr:TolC family outer membrane protein [Enterobacterales bacterium]